MYIERVMNERVFGYNKSINLPNGDPLYGKLTYSPDGYIATRQGEIALLEFQKSI